MSAVRSFDELPGPRGVRRSERLEQISRDTGLEGGVCITNGPSPGWPSAPR